MESPLPKIKPAHISLTKTEPPQLGFWFCSPNKPPLALDPIAPSLHLNLSIPRSNKVPSTSKLARLHFASQNPAPTAQFLVFSSNEPPLVPDQIVPSQYLNPSVPAPMVSPIHQIKPVHILLARTSPDRTLSPPQPQCAPLQ